MLHPSKCAGSTERGPCKAHLTPFLPPPRSKSKLCWRPRSPRRWRSAVGSWCETSGGAGGPPTTTPATAAGRGATCCAATTVLQPSTSSAGQSRSTCMHACVHARPGPGGARYAPGLLWPHRTPVVPAPPPESRARVRALLAVTESVHEWEQAAKNGVRAVCVYNMATPLLPLCSCSAILPPSSSPFCTFTPKYLV